MLYVIGGPAKVGKSRMAKHLVAELNVPYWPTDVAIEMLEANKLGKFQMPGRPDEFWPYFSAAMKVLPEYGDFCVEGNGFMPRHIKKLDEASDRDFKVVFLGMSEASLETILKHAGPDTWLLKDPDEKERAKYPEHLATNSKEIEQECRQVGYPYFDLAGDYEQKFEQAYQRLIRA